MLYGDSIVKLAPPANGSFAVLDYFTPYDQATLEAQDNDLGGGGLVLLPPLPCGQQLLAQQGKAGMIVRLGNAYSATLLGPSLNWNGNTYSLGRANIADAVSNTTVPLPAGSYATLSLLGTAVQGNHSNQVFTVNYTDGTSSSFTQSVSDWYTPQNYAGESQVLTMPYRVLRNGALDNRTFCLCGYSFALNPAKTVASLTLPNTRSVIVVAVDLQ